MDDLKKLENATIFLVREAYAQFKNIALLWSIGKDSTALLWITRKAFFGKIPFPVVHIDTGFKFREIYAFREKYRKEWGLDLLICRNKQAIKDRVSPERGKFACCHALKTKALQMAIEKYGFKALLLAIRRDEHGIRAKERCFSPRQADFKWDYRNQPPEMWNLYGSHATDKQHLRIHPMLHWTERNIWRYVCREKIPIVKLYFSRLGWRYRSIGCQPCCAPVRSQADSLKKIIKELAVTKEAERSGRAQDKEDTYTMQRLRSLGYM